jgi:hypothetical protein
MSRKSLGPRRVLVGECVFFGVPQVGFEEVLVKTIVQSLGRT